VINLALTLLHGHCLGMHATFVKVIKHKQFSWNDEVAYKLCLSIVSLQLKSTGGATIIYDMDMPIIG